MSYPCYSRRASPRNFPIDEKISESRNRYYRSSRKTKLIIIQLTVNATLCHADSSFFFRSRNFRVVFAFFQNCFLIEEIYRKNKKMNKNISVTWVFHLLKRRNLILSDLFYFLLKNRCRLERSSPSGTIDSLEFPVWRRRILGEKLLLVQARVFTTVPNDRFKSHWRASKVIAFFFANFYRVFPLLRRLREKDEISRVDGRAFSAHTRTHTPPRLINIESTWRERKS